MSGQTSLSLSLWLRAEMPRRGYPIEGPRAGGITRLAADAGISQATMSRLLSGRGEPSYDSLRKLGDLWGYSLQQMLVFAGLAEPDDRQPVDRTEHVPPEAASPGVRVERRDEAHVTYEVTVESQVTMEEAIASLGDLTPNELATVSMLQGMKYEPAEVAGAVLLLRGLDARRAEQRGPRRRKA